jgi:hypothetical protein
MCIVVVKNYDYFVRYCSYLGGVELMVR